MKRIILIVFFFFLLVRIQASHIISGEITYQYAGNGLFHITYIYYKYCQEPESTVQVQVRGSCGWSDYINLSLSNVPYEIIPQCSGSSICDGGLNPGILKCIYTGSIVVPAMCQSTAFSVVKNARTGAITTIINPDIYPLYIEAVATDTSLNLDSSPVFTNDPVVYTCINEPYCLDPGILDLDGDSIVCALVPPKSDANDFLNYKYGYSFSLPLRSTTALTFDSTNGTLCFTPSQPQITTYVIHVNSFRNGILIGQVEREIILYAIACSNSQPGLSGINGSNIYDTTVCANYPFCFDILSEDMDYSDSTSLSWDQGIPGGVFNLTPVKNESAQFCWTPQNSDVSNVPHCFTIGVQDNSCPAHQTKQEQYCITVIDSIFCISLFENNSIASQNEIQIYQNQAMLGVDFGSNPHKNSVFQLYNIVGKRILETIISEKSTLMQAPLPGIYIGYLFDDRGIILKKEKIIIR